jgi:hypothetical protein
MAGEKVGSKKPKMEPEAPKETTVNQIILTPEQLSDIVKQAVAGALSAQPQAPSGPTKAQIVQATQTTLTQKVNKRLQEGQRFSAALADPNGPRVTIIIDEIYQEYVGSAITATVNGNTIKVPVDGKPYPVHPAHFAVIKEKLHYVSKQRARNKGQEDVLGFAGEEGDFGQVTK